MKYPRSVRLSLALLPVVLAVLAYVVWHYRSEAGPAGPKVVALIRLTAVDANTMAGFKAGMVAAGYREGRDIVYLDQGPAGKIERLESLIRDCLARKPDLILVSSTPAAQAVKRLLQGRAIPVVFAPVNNPIDAGIVTDLKHPGGYITGIRLPIGDDLRLQWLAEIAPGVRRVFVPYSPDDKSALTSLALIGQAAPRLGLNLLLAPVRGDEGVQAALAAMPADVDAIFLPRDSRVESRIADIVAVARQRRLPVSAPSLVQVEAGALFSYGFVHTEIGHQAARLVDQIFRGVAPGDLPVEMAENVLSINLAAANLIGLGVPDRILLQAERVIRP